MAVLLSRHDVADLLSFGDAVEITENLYRNSGPDGQVTHAPVRLRTPFGSLRIVSGALLHSNVMGARLGSASGLRGDASPMALFTASSGDLLAIMAYPFSVIRTGATVAVATRALARSDARVAALIGTGRNALSVLQGMVHARPIERAHVYSRTPARRQALAEAATRSLGIPVSAAETTAEALAEADTVACVTNSPTPVFAAGELKADAHVNSVGSANEIPDEVFIDASGIFLGSKEQELQMAHYNAYGRDTPRNALLSLVWDGRVNWRADVHDLTDVYAPGWAAVGATAWTVFKETRGGVGDVALAYAVYQRARDLHRGNDLSL